VAHFVGGLGKKGPGGMGRGWFVGILRLRESDEARLTSLRMTGFGTYVV